MVAVSMLSLLLRYFSTCSTELPCRAFYMQKESVLPAQHDAELL